MLFYYITSFLTVITSFGLGIFVFLKNPHSSLHRSLLRLNTTVSLWSLFLFLHYISKTENFAFITLRLLHSFAIFIPACYLHFVVNLLDIDRRKAIRFSYIVSIIFLGVSYHPNFITAIGPKLCFSYYATAGNLYIGWIIAYTLIALYGAYLLIKNYYYVSPLKKIQIKYVLFASMIGFTGGSTIYPLLYNIPIPPWGEHIIFLYPLIFAIAVLKHDVFELNIVIKRTLVYSISLFLITAAYIVLVLISERFLRDIFGYQSIWITVGAAVLIALLFTPIKNKIQLLIEKFYIKSAYQKLQKELVEIDKNKALQSLAAGLAHEIRNPLTAIKVFSEYLPEKFDDKAFREKFSRIVSEETEKINALITELLEFSKPSSLKIGAVDVHQLLNYTLNLLSGEILKANIKIVKNYQIKDATIQADSNKLKHVFHNLIKNSIESIVNKGTITISTAIDNDRLKIEITDTGSGISQKDITKIFDPFYSSKKSGTGLGLAVAQTVISEHQGSIYTQSTLGQGTTFAITLKK